MTSLLPAPVPARAPAGTRSGLRGRVATLPLGGVVTGSLVLLTVLVTAVLVTAVLVTAVLVTALQVGGGAPSPATPGLTDAGPVVGWGQPVLSLAGRVLAVLVVGSLLVAAVLVPAPDGLGQASRRAVRTAAAAAAGWAACEVAGLVLLTGSLLGTPVTRLVPADVWAVTITLPAGRTVPAVLALLALVVAGRGARTAGQAALLLLVALAAVVLPVATTGHPAAAGDHVTTVVVLAVHVVTASLWVGGLLGVLVHLRRPVGVPAVLARTVAVQRLSRLALGCVAAVTVTGVLGALLVTDTTWASLPGLLGSGYGALLLVKTGAVVLLVVAGWVHRRRTLPALEAGRAGAFTRVAVVETVLMAATLAVAAGLSSAPPPEATAGAAAPAPVTVTPDSPALPDDPAAPAVPDGAGDAGAAGPPGPEDPAVPAPVEDMLGHDHGELSVAVLVDADRLHVGDPVTAGAPVTVYNTGPAPVLLQAADGSFSATVPSRTFITFPAPSAPGGHAFGDPSQARYSDVLQVIAPPS